MSGKLGGGGKKPFRIGDASRKYLHQDDDEPEERKPQRRAPGHYSDLEAETAQLLAAIRGEQPKRPAGRGLGGTQEKKKGKKRRGASKARKERKRPDSAELPDDRGPAKLRGGPEYAVAPPTPGEDVFFEDDPERVFYHRNAGQRGRGRDAGVRGPPLHNSMRERRRPDHEVDAGDRYGGMMARTYGGGRVRGTVELLDAPDDMSTPRTGMTERSDAQSILETERLLLGSPIDAGQAATGRDLSQRLLGRQGEPEVLLDPLQGDERRQRDRRHEMSLRSLTFEQEEQRVRDGVDQFVPQQGLTEGELRLHQERAAASEARMAERERLQRAGLERKQRAVAHAKEEDAAVSIQRVLRGSLDRQRTQELADVIHDAYARADEGGLVMQEITDPFTGDVYVLNTNTGARRRTGMRQSLPELPQSRDGGRPGSRPGQSAPMPRDSRERASTADELEERLPPLRRGDTEGESAHSVEEDEYGRPFSPEDEDGFGVDDDDAFSYLRDVPEQQPRMAGMTGSMSQARMHMADCPTRYQPQSTPTFMGDRVDMVPMEVPEADGLAADGRAAGPQTAAGSRPRTVRFPSVGADENGGRHSDSSDADSVATDLDANEADGPRLFNPDGSRNVKLSDTIRNALRSNRFENVSTLLASDVKGKGGRRAKGKAGAAADGRPSTADREQSGRVGVGLLASDTSGRKFVGAVAKKKNVERMTEGELTKHRPALPQNSQAKRYDDADPTGQNGPAIHHASPGGFNATDPNAQDERSAQDIIGGAMGPQDVKLPKKQKEVCFYCWSKGEGSKCDLHHHEQKQARKLAPGESALVCSNWDIGALARKHRSEELQEVFARTNSSLRYDRVTGRFVTIVESRHPLYRALYDAVAHHNERVRRARRVRTWFRSLMELVEVGIVGGHTRHPQLLRLKNTIANNRYVKRYMSTVRHRHGIGMASHLLPKRPHHKPMLTTADKQPIGAGYGLGLFIEDVGVMDASTDGEGKVQDGEDVPSPRADAPAFSPIADKPDGDSDDDRDAQQMALAKTFLPGHEDDVADPDAAKFGVTLGQITKGGRILTSSDEVYPLISAGLGKGAVNAKYVAACRRKQEDKEYAELARRRETARLLNRNEELNKLDMEEAAMKARRERWDSELSIQGVSPFLDRQHREGIVYAEEPAAVGDELGLDIRPAFPSMVTLEAAGNAGHATGGSGFSNSFPQQPASPRTAMRQTDAEKELKDKCIIAIGSRLQKIRRKQQARERKRARREATGDGSGGDDDEASKRRREGSGGDGSGGDDSDDSDDSYVPGEGDDDDDDDYDRMGEKLGQDPRIPGWIRHQDTARRPWRYIIALPKPRPKKLYQPRQYRPYEPRYVPLFLPPGSTSMENDRITAQQTAEAAAKEQHRRAQMREVDRRTQIRQAVADGTLSPDDGVFQIDTQGMSLVGLPDSVPSFVRITRHVPTLKLYSTFYRNTKRTLVKAGLPAETLVTAWISTYVPAQFGGYKVMRVPTVAPVHVPDVVRLKVRGGAVDISNAFRVGTNDAVLAAGEEGFGVFDDYVDYETRVVEALFLIPFGESEVEEWEKPNRARKQELELRQRLGILGHGEADELNALKATAVHLPDGMDTGAGEGGDDEDAPARGKRGGENMDTHDVLKLKGAITFPTYFTPERQQPRYSLEPLVSPLDTRRPPTVTASTLAYQHAHVADLRPATVRFEQDAADALNIRAMIGRAPWEVDPPQVYPLDYQNLWDAEKVRRDEIRAKRRVRHRANRDEAQASTMDGGSAETLGEASVMTEATSAENPPAGGMVPAADPGYDSDAEDDEFVGQYMPEEDEDDGYDYDEEGRRQPPHESRKVNWYEDLYTERVYQSAFKDGSATADYNTATGEGAGMGRIVEEYGRTKLKMAVLRGHSRMTGDRGARLIVVQNGDVKHFYGFNRGNQTEEDFFCGFRTSHAVLPRLGDTALTAGTFTPNADVAMPNEAATIDGVTTNADRNYPFCSPSSGKPSSLDFYHLLVTSAPTSNSPCCFTVLGHQDAGMFMQANDPNAGMGPLAMHVYRSFGFTQTGEIEEFETSTGVPYWYNRRTGETFWEPPLPDPVIEEEEAELEAGELGYLGDAAEEGTTATPAAATGGGVSLSDVIPKNLYERDGDGQLIHADLLEPDGLGGYRLNEAAAEERRQEMMREWEAQAGGAATTLTRRNLRRGSGTLEAGLYTEDRMRQYILHRRNTDYVPRGGMSLPVDLSDPDAASRFLSQSAADKRAQQATMNQANEAILAASLGHGGLQQQQQQHGVGGNAAGGQFGMTDPQRQGTGFSMTAGSTNQQFAQSAAFPMPGPPTVTLHGTGFAVSQPATAPYPTQSIGAGIMPGMLPHTLPASAAPSPAVSMMNHDALLRSLQSALSAVLPQLQQQQMGASGDNFLGLGLGLGLGIGLRQAMEGGGGGEAGMAQSQMPWSMAQTPMYTGGAMMASTAPAGMQAPGQFASTSGSLPPGMGMGTTSHSFAPGMMTTSGSVPSTTGSEFGMSTAQFPMDGSGMIPASHVPPTGVPQGARAVGVPAQERGGAGPSQLDGSQTTAMLPTPDEMTVNFNGNTGSEMHDQSSMVEVGGVTIGRGKSLVAGKPAGADGRAMDTYKTHAPAGLGTAFVKKNEPIAKGALRKSGNVISRGFVTSIYHTHVGKQYVDYLPAIPNLNTPQSLGVVMPRQIIEDWTAAAFDPWSAGKKLRFTTMCSDLDELQNAAGGATAVDKIGDFDTKLGATADEEATAAAAKAAREATQLENLFSLCRNGKYTEIEEFLLSPDNNLEIDARDSIGNTLLLVAAQNGNKRISKLALRRGADINVQNLNGQSALHYCFAYGFEDLAHYLIEKGADDSLKNADGLTCYEGLNIDDVDNL